MWVIGDHVITRLSNHAISQVGGYLLKLNVRVGDISGDLGPTLPMRACIAAVISRRLALGYPFS